MRERTHNLNHTAGGHNNAAEKKTLRHRGRDLQPARAVSWLAVAERLKGQKRLTDLCDELINKCHFFPSTWQTGYLEFLKTDHFEKKNPKHEWCSVHMETRGWKTFTTDVTSWEG